MSVHVLPICACVIEIRNRCTTSQFESVSRMFGTSVGLLRFFPQLAEVRTA